MPLSPEDAAALDDLLLDLLRADKPFEAVKDCRDLSGCSLREATRHIAALARHHAIAIPASIANV